MRIIVTSDNHGLKKELNMLRELHADYDAFIHCGDSEMTNKELAGWASVAGNNDYYAELPEARIVNVNGYKIFVTHSHLVSYFNRTERLVQLAKKNECQMVCFGHTHVYMNEIVDGVHLVNPGSMRYNRDASAPCYAIIHIDNEDYSKVAVRRITLNR